VFVGGVRLSVWVVLVVCVSVSGVLFSVGVCVCDLLIFLLKETKERIRHSNIQCSTHTKKQRLG